MVWGQAANSGVEDLVKRLKANDPALKSLTILRFRRLNDEDVQLLSQAIEGNSVLQELICSSHAISSQAAANLGSMLQQNSCLQRISIGNSTLGDEALAALVAGGLQQNKSLLMWDLEHKGLSHASAPSVSQVLQSHPNLQHLLLSRNDLADPGLLQLCANPWASLKNLELANCGITHQGVPCLATAPSIGQLAQLDLSHNALGPAAAASLSQLLSNARQLQNLRLKGTQLGDAGVKGVAEGLPAAGLSLALLDLSSNAVGTAGVAALADAITAHPVPGSALQQLVLADNPAVDDDAVCKLAWSLQAATGTAAAAAAAAAAAEGGSSADDAPGSSSSSSKAGDGSTESRRRKQQLALDLSHAGVGAAGVAALSEVSGLTQLSFFGCKLGGNEGSACTALVDAIRRGSFAALQELNITGCELNLQQLAAVMAAVGAAGPSGAPACCLPSLVTLELGANVGVQEEGFEGLVSGLRGLRPGLDVHWRVADSDSGPER